MANKNFVVQHGLTVGPLTIDAATGDINTSGNVVITGNLGVSQIAKNDSSVSITDTGSGSSVTINIDGTTEHTVDADGVNLASGDRFAIAGDSMETVNDFVNVELFLGINIRRTKDESEIFSQFII
jgi:uncharacterized protein (DUF342 family)